MQNCKEVKSWRNQRRGGESLFSRLLLQLVFVSHRHQAVSHSQCLFRYLPFFSKLLYKSTFQSVTCVASGLPALQLQSCQLLLPWDDLRPRDPELLHSLRVSGYCISSIDVPNDMAITDAGHESKVLNHPARWSVKQVLLSDAQQRTQDIEIRSESSLRRCCAALGSDLAAVDLRVSRTDHSDDSCLVWTELVNALTPSNQQSLNGREREGKYTQKTFCTAYQSITLVPFYLARLKLEKHKSARKMRITHVSNMLNFNW